MGEERMKRFLDAERIGNEGHRNGEDLSSITTKMALATLPDLLAICERGPQDLSDECIIKATLHWAAAVLVEMNDGKLKLMKVEGI